MCGDRTWSQQHPPKALLSRRAVRWALEALVCQHLSVSRVAQGLAVAWGTANDAVLAEGLRLLINDPARLEGVRVVGVDEHVWRHTRKGDKYVTVVIDLTPIREGTGPARLLDMVPGRSKQAFKAWLSERDQAWRRGVEVVAMDGFSGFKTAATEEMPQATPVLDPFHVVKLAGDALDRCRRRIQQEIHGHRGRADDPLYKARRTLHTGKDLLTPGQHRRLEALFAEDDHAQVEVTWGVYQKMVTAYRQPERAKGKSLMRKLITAISSGVPAALSEVITLGRTLKKRAADVLAYFDCPKASNGPTEALNGRLEHLRGTALDFRNLTNYITRSLLETGGFKPHLHPQMGRAAKTIRSTASATSYARTRNTPPLASTPDSSTPKPPINGILKSKSPGTVPNNYDQCTTKQSAHQAAERVTGTQLVANPPDPGNRTLRPHPQPMTRSTPGLLQYQRRHRNLQPPDRTSTAHGQENPQPPDK